MIAAQERTDAELLGAFIERRDEEAFEEVVRRHEALVVNACRRVLGNPQDALDAAQAVFLALALKAGALDLGRPLAPWLHRVAYGVAVNARKARESRTARERKAMERAALPAPPEALAESLRPLLDEELDRLPGRYRRPLILFHLEGKSLEETAAALESPVGTVGAWLSRGREMLRDRLARRGVTALTAAALTAVLAREAAASAAEYGFASWTAKAAVAAARGVTGAGGFVSGPVLAMAKGALNMMIAGKVKAGIVGLILLGGILALNVACLPGRESPAPPAAAAAPRALPARPAPAPEPAVATAGQEEAAAKKPDLLGHWKLDEEKSSKSAADSSGRGYYATLVGEALWTEGKLGGAIKLDGKGGHVEIPRNDDLDKLHEGSYTIAAWFMPEDVPPGQESDNNARYGIVNRCGWHTGLSYTSEQKFVMEHWLDSGKEDEPTWDGAGTWEDTYDAGRWYHVVGIVDRDGGKVQLYVNGELRSEKDFAPKAKAFTSKYPQPWRIGNANPGGEKWAWPAKGAIDDVRLYTRALAGAEVKALFEGK